MLVGKVGRKVSWKTAIRRKAVSVGKVLARRVGFRY